VRLFGVSDYQKGFCYMHLVKPTNLLREFFLENLRAYEQYSNIMHSIGPVDTGGQRSHRNKLLFLR